MPIPLLAVANLLHLLAVVVWIGGLVVFRLVVWPATDAVVRGGHVSELARRSLVSSLNRRSTSLTYGAMVIFLITGTAMMSQNPNYQGFLQIGSLWTIVILAKHVVIAGLVLSTVYVSNSINKQMDRLAPGEDAAYARLEERQKDMLDLNALLGVIVLGLTAIATAIPAGG